jgi:hypothetical protein
MLFVDSGPMKDVLRPAVAFARNYSEHVFHAERDPSPVVCFHFGHGHDEIRCQDRSWKPQVAKTGMVGPELCPDESVSIEIHECDLALRKLIVEAGLI